MRASVFKGMHSFRGAHERESQVSNLNFADRPGEQVSRPGDLRPVLLIGAFGCGRVFFRDIQPDLIFLNSGGIQPLVRSLLGKTPAALTIELPPV